MTELWLPVVALWRREIVRFVRQRSRVTGAFAQPLVFWLLLGGGLNASFQPAGAAPGTSYVEYFYPGTIALVLLFTAIFATISTVEDRREGFLQGVLVAPVPRWAIVLGQALGGTSLAVLQGILFLLLAPLLGISLSFVSVLAMILVMLIVSLSLTSLGLDHRLADGIDAGISRHHESHPAADLVAVRRVLPRHRCAGTLALADDPQPAHLRHGRVAPLPVPDQAVGSRRGASVGTIARDQRRILRRRLRRRRTQR